MLGRVVGVAAMCIAGGAQAIVTPPHLAGRPALEVASGPPVRVARLLSWYRTPPRAAVTWRAILDELGPNTHAVWDPITAVPARIWGEGIAVAGADASAEAAEKHARGLLSRHIELLAPGAQVADFVVVSNVVSGGVRSVGLVQHHGGLRVLGGQLSFRYKNDRLFMIASEALPHVAAPEPTVAIAPAKLAAAARAWVLADVATTVATDGIDGPFVLPLVASGVRYHTVMRVDLDARAPRGRWSVYVDAISGQPVAREQTLRFADGTVLYNAPERWPGSTRTDYSASFASLTVDGAAATTDVDGLVSWPTSASASVTVQAQGSYVDVNHVSGAPASASLSLSPSASVTWDESANELTDAQVVSYVHTNRVIEYIRAIDPQLPYLQQQVDVNVNDTDEDILCNAYYSGQNGSLNFSVSTQNCGNTGRLADVVYHEYGHAIHDNSIIEGVGDFSSPLSEGVSDYLAATVADDPAMGVGFFKNGQPLRHIDPPGFEYVWPDDIAEAHHFGYIISGALWDLRKLLIAKYGQVQGVATTDNLYYQAMRRSVDIPSMYFEVLATDDTNGNLADGTPNICEINEAFAAHGLRRMSHQLGALTATPANLDGFDVTLEVVEGLYQQCGDMPDASLIWQLREQPSVNGVVAMTGGPAYSAKIPPQPDGQVVQYRIELQMGSGEPVAFPDNPADVFYEMFVGEIEPIYCTDFETDPALDGWTHGLTQGNPSQGADDWQWGTPVVEVASGDPSEAFSGDSVYGNDLGGGQWNGTYQPNKTNFTDSPAVDTAGYDNIRLQYRRWLNVEDGFYDQATIYGNDVTLWTNYNSNADQDSARHHQDREWRFHDVDLSQAVQNDQVTVKHEISSDQGLHFGGWTLDDWCIVAWIPTVCGDGEIAGNEQCDDGDGNSDTTPDACRTSCELPSCGDDVTDSDEACDDGNSIDGDSCSNRCTPNDEPPDNELPAEDDGAASDQSIRVEQACICQAPGGPTSAGWWHLLWAVPLLARRKRLL